MDKKLSLFELLEFSTVRLETVDAQGKLWASSGFFYTVSKKDDPSRGQVFIITNRHAVEGMEKITFCMSRKGEDGGPVYEEPLRHEIAMQSMQVIYLDDESIDVCAIPITFFINLRQQTGHNIFYQSLSEDLILTEEEAKQLDAVEDIVMIGYPNGLWDEKHNIPLIRKGITSTPVYLDYNGKPEFMIDAACFQGSSGSPILICDQGQHRDKFGSIILGGTRLKLIGVLYSAPVMNIKGELVIESKPNQATEIKPNTRIPVNIGRVANYKALRMLTNNIRVQCNIN